MRGECKPAVSPLRAYMVDGIDFSSPTYQQHCGAAVLRDFPAYTVQGLATRLDLNGVGAFVLADDVVAGRWPAMFSPSHVTAAQLTDATATYWRDGDLVRSGWGHDHNSADFFNLVFLGGHGTAALDALGNPHRGFSLTRGGADIQHAFGTGQKICDIYGTSRVQIGNNVAHVWDMRLGAGAFALNGGARTSMVVWSSSCSMNDNTWAETNRLNRLGQEFGFERSPIINDGLFFESWYQDTGAASNQEAWIVNGIKINAAKEQVTINAGAVATAQMSSVAEAEDLFRNSSLRLKCRMEEKTGPYLGVDSVVRWRKAMTPCVFNSVCGKPQFCEPNPDGGFPEGVGKNGQALLSVPTTPNQHPPGNQMMQVQVTIPNPSNLEVATAAATIAQALAPAGAQAFNPKAIEPFIAQNRSDRLWTFNHIGEGILVGYSAARNQLRVLNRDVVDVWTAPNVPLDIGPQDAFERASEIARNLGMSLKGLTSSQVGADNPTLNVIADGKGQNGVQYRTFAYVFSMFRNVNGVPVIDIEYTIAIHRSGQLYYADITTAGPATHGPAGFEVPTVGNFVPALFDSAVFLQTFDSRFRSEFEGVYDRHEITWSGFVYTTVQRGSNWLEPVFMVEFVGSSSVTGVVGRRERWVFSVAEPSSLPTSLPNNILGESAE